MFRSAQSSPTRTGTLASRRALCTILLVGLALIPAISLTASTGAATAAPLTCTPTVINWHFQASNNYAAPSPGSRYVKEKDGCQSVWIVNQGALTTFHVVYNCGSGTCTTHDKACPPNVVCQIWESAENGVKFYVADTSKNDDIATIKF